MSKSNRDQLIGAIDQIDVGLGLLRCAFLATTAEGGVLADDIEAIGITLNEALQRLEPNREVIHGVVQNMPREAMR